MREILFRGKRKDNSEWLYGYLVIRNEKYFIYYEEPDEMCQTGNWFCNEEVIPETVGQYTGLTDVNNVKMFEGDILRQLDKYDATFLTRVCKYEMSCGACCSQVYGFGASGSQHLDFIRLGEPFKIIGNIHDNPELVDDLIEKAKTPSGRD